MTTPMIETFSSSARAVMGPLLANHLWQSTLFAGVAGLLALALRKNRAEARCWLWRAASVKFLIPFSMLVGIGSHLAWSKVAAVTPTGFGVMQEIGQPFAATKPGHAVGSAAPSAFAATGRVAPFFLLAIWLCGCMGVLVYWWLRWRRMKAIVRAAVLLETGRELEVLRRIERGGEIGGGIKLVVSESALEPGIVGISRPVMLLPSGMSERLTDVQLEAILRHEACHVRCRDNLAAAVHMLVEAVFWFYPLVWWIGARLIDERERACDEEVLRLGSEPQAYAEGILKVCEFYLESPLVCVAGVTGSNLKKRMEAIMIHRAAGKLGWGKKMLLAMVAAAALVGPVAIGLANPASSRAQAGSTTSPAAFENVSIRPIEPGSGEKLSRIGLKPGGFEATNIPLAQLIEFAYGLGESQLSGGPAWVTSERYDLNATVDASVSDVQLRKGLQSLLVDRFKLAIHPETKEAPVYELLVAKGGPKMNEVQLPSTAPKKSMIQFQPGQLTGHQVGMVQLARALSHLAGRLVIDKTGLTGLYDFRLQWTAAHASPAVPEGSLTPDEITSLLAGVQEQLGLEMNEQTAPVDMLVIDHAEEISGT